MKVSAQWVNYFLSKPLKTQALADAMELAAIEVEEVIQAKPFDDQIVVGKVVQLESHPNAQKLKVAQVDVKKSTLSIVCGAANIAVGQIVPVAQVGAKLPDGTVIESVVLRGVHSHGMICSQAELGLSTDHSGIMVLDNKYKPGSKINNVIEQHDVIHVKTAANRWDLNSVIGIAREVAGQTSQKLKHNYPEYQMSSTSRGAKLDNPELASRYMAARLRVKTGAVTPAWLVQHLEASGVRSISPIVDITNCIMLEYGQPLHAFDAAKIEGGITVRFAKKNERFTTLDGVDRKLDSADIVITDTKKVVALAGVMGGANSEIDDSTTEIILEAASFHPAALRRTAVRHGLRTDASARFERNLPVDLPPIALQAAVDLLKEIVGAEVTGEVIDINPVKPVTTKVSVKPNQITKFLGIELAPAKVLSELAKLGFASQGNAGETATITVPWWRPDVMQEEDVAEELIKLVGYEQLPATLPAWRPQSIGFDQHWSQLWRAKAVLRSMGLFEVVTYSFISEQDITRLGWKTKDFLKLQNPLSSEQAYLREVLLPSHLNTLAKNRTYAKDVGIFEFSKTYVKRGEGKLPQELFSLGILVTNQKQGYTVVKAALDRLAQEFNVDAEIKPKVYDKHIAHPTRSGEVNAGGDWLGLIGQIHPALTKQYKLSGEVGYLELSWELFLKHAQTKAYTATTRFPSIKRDISIVVNRDVTWNEVTHTLADFAVSFVSDYYGADLEKDKKSLTIRLNLSSDERTLTDKEADELTQRALQLLKQHHNALLRS